MAPIKENLQFKILKTDFTKARVSFKDVIQDAFQLSLSEVELNRLAVFIRSKINQMNDQVEDLERISNNEDDFELRKCMLEEKENWINQIQDDHRVFRKAMLSAQLALTQRNKDELFKHSTSIDEETLEGYDNQLRHRNKMTRDFLTKKSSQLSDDLLSVTRLIKENTDKSSKTLDKLVESSQMATSTQEELKTMGSVIGQAKKILSKYGRRENTDKLLIFLGLLFFLASCLVVIRNRFIFFF